MSLIKALHVYCDHCSKELKTPKDGFCIQGNVYGARVDDSRYGLIGNNFPPLIQNGQINVDDIKVVDLCTDCFWQALGTSQIDSKQLTIGKIANLQILDTTIEEVFIYKDIPKLFLCATKDQFYLAISVENTENCYIFLYVPVTVEQKHQLTTDVLQTTLTLFENIKYTDLYKVSISTKNNNSKYVQLIDKSSIPKEWLDIGKLFVE